MTKELIDKINKKCPYEQGIFIQPTGINTDIKEPVIYSRYRSAYVPGSCFDDENTVNERNECDVPKDHLLVLDVVLNIIAPKLTHLQRRMINGLIQEDSKTEYGYYGDYDEYTCQYIILRELEEYLATI